MTLSAGPLHHLRKESDARPKAFRAANNGIPVSAINARSVELGSGLNFVEVAQADCGISWLSMILLIERFIDSQ